MQLFSNNAGSTLNGAITNVATSVTVQDVDASRFPSPTGGDFFLVTLFQKLGATESNHEIIKCTARTGSVLTVVRGQEGTLALSFASGDSIELRETAGTLASKASLDGATFTGPVAGITAAMVGAPSGSGTSTGANTGDETATTIRSKLAITTLSGSNTGDQTNITGNAGTATALSIGADRTKLDGIATGATNYTHPANHPASIITQDSSNRFVTDAEKSTWNAKGVGDVTLTGAQTLTNKTITETVFSITGTTPALTATNGAVQTWTLTAASTPTNALTTGQSIILVITPGAFAITWPSVVWTKQGGSGAAPTLFSAGKTSVVLWLVGTVLYGSHLGDTV